MEESPRHGSGVIAAFFEFFPFALIDISSISSESQSYLDLRYRSDRDIQVPCELLPTSFGATFCNICGNGEPSSAEL